jgi:hypothetical protein
MTVFARQSAAIRSRRARRDDGGVREQLHGLVVRFDDDRAERCSSTAAAVGGYVVVIASVVPSLALTLTSSYVCSLGGAQAAVTHLYMAPGQPDQISQRALAPLVGQTLGRAYLLDHAAELQTRLGELRDESLAVELDDELMEVAGAVWRAAI